MTDLEMTRLCAEAMGYTEISPSRLAAPQPSEDAVRVCVGKKAPFWYWPLHNDAQVMALVKRFNLTVYPPGGMENEAWNVFLYDDHNSPSDDLSRAIVECVAKMQAGKK